MLEDGEARSISQQELLNVFSVSRFPETVSSCSEELEHVWRLPLYAAASLTAETTVGGGD